MDEHSRTSSHLAYSLTEAARIISVSRWKLYQMIGSGELRTVKLGRRRLVPATELQQLLQPCGQPAAIAPEAVASTVEAPEAAPSPPPSATIAPEQPARERPALSQLLAAIRAQKASAAG